MILFDNFIDERFQVAPGDLLRDRGALVTDATPVVVIPGVESLRLEAQVVPVATGLFQPVDQTPREVVVEIDLPEPTTVGLALGLAPFGGTGGFGVVDGFGVNGFGVNGFGGNGFGAGDAFLFA